ncbi:DUF397 domain-containing protein [Actinomadura sp. NBRC 104412]|uniref:DUF397 domain-containing protein n=1 Tax=Actinomadura sp. NBRC 104412 TaxID=3032203 RepID=UPI0024A03907|nr:DUF397 domain-containing protein [Actinomadura sp. NBRC 104412]GLZ07746.1 DUF397 domain-containing protein [Actinomadura sp. NBRC 104412]
MNHPHHALTSARWRKSSYSGSGDQCVEVAELDAGTHAVRDSKDPHGPALTLTAAEWRSFIEAVRRA